MKAVKNTMSVEVEDDVETLEAEEDSTTISSGNLKEQKKKLKVRMQ